MFVIFQLILRFLQNRKKVTFYFLTKGSAAPLREIPVCEANFSAVEILGNYRIFWRFWAQPVVVVLMDLRTKKIFGEHTKWMVVLNDVELLYQEL